MTRPVAPPPPPSEVDDGEDLSSRTDHRKARLASEDRLARLGAALMLLTEKQLARLALDEELLAVVRGARAIKSAPARNRYVKVVRSALRDLDVEPLLARYEELPGFPPLDGGRGGNPRRKV